MDSIGLRVHTPKDAYGEYGANRDLVHALILNSRANQSLLRNSVDFMSYSVPIMANELAMHPIDYMVKQLHWVQDDKKLDIIQGRFQLPSSHYDVGYRLNIERQFVDISFSIPKYVYGHSVAQFVRNAHPLNTFFRGVDVSLEEGMSSWYDMFVSIIKDFFHRTFTGCNVDYKYIEVTRIDFAFNQYFRSKNEAQRVSELMSQKRVSSLKGKRGRNTFQHDDLSTGWISVQKNVYYKVYHKGTEFSQVGDKKRLISHNDKARQKVMTMRKEFGLYDLEHYSQDDLKAIKRIENEYGKFYDVDALQSEADLIMRHEIRFYPKTFSNIWKRKVFRANCPIWRKKLKRYRELDNKRVRHYSNPQKHEPMTRSEIDEHKKTHAILKKRTRFFLKVENEVYDHEKKYNDKHEDYYGHALFSEKLFNEMINKFITIIRDTQIEHFPEWDTLKIKAEEYNVKANAWNNNLSYAQILNPKLKKMQVCSIPSLRRVYERMITHGSLDKAFEDGYYSPATYYRWRALLKELGYSSTMAHEPILSDASFRTYHERIKGIGVGKPRYNVYFRNIRQAYKYDY